MIDGFALSRTGRSHIKRNAVCQDASKLVFIRNQRVAIGAIADGVGSCLYSDKGAQCAVDTVVETLSEALDNRDEMPDTEELLILMKMAFEKAAQAVQERSEKEKHCCIEYDSTLTAAIYLLDGTLIWGHIGDDGIVVLERDGKSAMITHRNKGEYENEVIPLRCEQARSFGCEQRVASFAMMSDGVLDYCVDKEENDNQLHDEFFHCLLHVICVIHKQMEKLCQGWEKSFTGDEENSFHHYVDDDMTVLMVSNSDLLGAMEKDNIGDIWRFEEPKKTEKPKRKHRRRHAKFSGIHRSPSAADECEKTEKGKVNRL